MKIATVHFHVLNACCCACCCCCYPFRGRWKETVLYSIAVRLLSNCPPTKLDCNWRSATPEPVSFLLLSARCGLQEANGRASLVPLLYPTPHSLLSFDSATHLRPCTHTHTHTAVGQMERKKKMVGEKERDRKEKIPTQTHKTVYQR